MSPADFLPRVLSVKLLQQDEEIIILETYDKMFV